MNKLTEALLFSSIMVQSEMHALLADFDSRLVEAMRYSVMSGGKRIRPFILISSARIFGTNYKESVRAAAALEFIHTYSLIHDDLPAMDNDDYRRGKPTCHKQFDDATAILAGDALLTYAFEVLADAKTHSNPDVRCRLIATLAKAAGYKGMAGGQMMDIENSGRKISKEEMAKLHRLKTGELFMAAAEMGAILGQAGINERKALHHYAHDLGLAFQIKDDIIDHSLAFSGAEHIKVGIDEMGIKKNKDNVSIVELIGIEAARAQLQLLKNQAVECLQIFGDKAEVLVDLAEFVINRDG